MKYDYRIQALASELSKHADQFDAKVEAHEKDWKERCPDRPAPVPCNSFNLCRALSVMALEIERLMHKVDQK